MGTTKTLIRHRGCAGWFESSLDAHARHYVFLCCELCKLASERTVCCKKTSEKAICPCFFNFLQVYAISKILTWATESAKIAIAQFKNVIIPFTACVSPLSKRTGCVTNVWTLHRYWHKILSEKEIRNLYTLITIEIGHIFAFNNTLFIDEPKTNVVTVQFGERPCLVRKITCSFIYLLVSYLILVYNITYI